MTSESMSSIFQPDPPLQKPRQPLSAPPTPPASDARSSPPAKSGSFILLCLEATLEEAPTLQDDGGNSVVNSPADDKHRKRSARYALFESGNHEEDCDLPTKRLRALKTMWNHTFDSNATNYLNERMLELSWITCQALAARVRYQCLRAHELDLIKSILKEETELSQKQIHSIDLQIGSIRNMLQDGGVTSIGNKGCKFDPSNHGPWCESSASDDDGSMFGSDATSASLSDE
ncbi:hypothetical protein BDR06DRAFT_1011707 [Suillus hirtellus]|nr:hypothetical protein BDR06DRAFT_1011707 [Suillus hirtellus]